MAESIEQLSATRLKSLIALNGEIAALSRVGLPLESGLAAATLGGLSDRVADRLRAGRSLEEALADDAEAVPPAYRAVLAAGVRCGRLPEALNSVSQTAALRLRLRQRVRIASIYPMVLLCVGYFVLAVVVPFAIDSIWRSLLDANLAVPNWLAGIHRLLTENPTGWKYWLPILVLVGLIGSGGFSALTLSLPGLKLAVRSQRLAAFSELLAVLLESNVPLEDALHIAADGSGDPDLRSDAIQLSDRLRAGESLAQILPQFTSLPAFPRWLILAGAGQGTLPASLHQVADWAQRRATVRSEWFLLTAPVVTVVLVGGLTTLVVALALFTPMVRLLYAVAQQVSP